MKTHSITLIIALFIHTSLKTVLSGQMRPRPVIQNRTLVSGDNFVPLRGTAMNIWNEAEELAYNTDVNNYIKCRDQLNMNCVRVCNFQAWVQTHQGDNSWDLNKTLSKLDLAVDAAETAGMYVILNYHDFPFDEPAGDYTENQRWQMCSDFWTAAAARFKDKTHVVFELVNEPSSNGPNMKYYLNHQIKDLYNIVSAAAPNTIILIGTPWTAGNMPDVSGSWSLKELADLCSWADWSKTILSWHCYPGERYAWGGDFEASITDFLENSDKPWFCTEYGDNLSTDDYWNGVENLSYYGFKMETEALETVCHIGWCDWWSGSRSDENFQKYGLDRLKYDAEEKGYYWPGDLVNSVIKHSISSSFAFSIYPNPAREGEITISFLNNDNGAGGTLCIANVLGQHLFSIQPTMKGDFKIHSADIGSGYYIITYKNGDISRTGNLLVL